MLKQAEKAYYFALQALKSKRYAEALNYFHSTGEYFKDNGEFNILRETTELLVSIKDVIANSEGRRAENDQSIFVGEVLDDAG